MEAGAGGFATPGVNRRLIISAMQASFVQARHRQQPAARASDTGITRVLGKPVRRAQLANAIKALLD